MSFFTKQGSLFIGVGLIILTNTIALIGVAYNRSGAPHSQLLLSDRELNYYHAQNDDNSGVSVEFDWQVITDPSANIEFHSWKNYSHRAGWLTKAKLNQLGFDITKPDGSLAEPDSIQRLKDREVFLVLEFNGPSYQQYLQEIRRISATRKDKEAAIVDLLQAENNESRLFVVDASLNADSLSQRYSDKKMYAIVRGIISAHWEGTDTKPELFGYINSLSVSTLHVSKPNDAVFNSIPPNENSAKYHVTVAFGQRYEPWIVLATK